MADTRTIDDVIEEHFKHELDKVNEIWMHRTGQPLSQNELALFELGLATGVNIAGVGLAHSTVNLLSLTDEARS